MGQTIVIAGPERRRRWSDEQKRSLLAQAFCPGGNVAEVARRADICTSLLYRWRQEQRAQRRAPAFVPAVMVDAQIASSASGSEAVIVVELAAGTRVTIAAAASPTVISATLGALR
jgi:transposase